MAALPPGGPLSPASRRLLVSAALFVLGVLVVVNGALWWLYGRFRSDLDDQLGARLRGIAVTAAAGFDPDLVTPAFGANDRLTAGQALRPALDRLADQTELSNVLVLRTDGSTLCDLSGLSRPGERHPLVDLDRAAFDSALAGRPAASRQYRSGQAYFKSAVAPIRDEAGHVLGTLAVEAGAGYFTVLGDIQRRLVLLSGLSVVALAGLAFVFLVGAIRLARLEESLRRSETLATMGQMTAMLAHEIRNPLGIIRGAAERLTARYDPGGDEMFQFIPEEVDRLNAILTRYLDFARSGGGEMGTARLDRVAEEAKELVADALARSGHRLELVLHEDARRPFVGDEAGLKQALLNLLLNAAQAMPGGGEIEVSVTRAGERVRLTVADRGPGVSAGVRRQLGRPFVTTREKGSGLGLAIVRRVADAHGGRLRVEDRPGGGSLITLDLPARTAGGPGENS